MTIGTKVLYDCNECRLREREVRVPFRQHDESVVSWMGAVTIAVSSDHTARSPHCRATHITQVKIEMPPGSQKLGGPMTH